MAVAALAIRSYRLATPLFVGGAIIAAKLSLTQLPEAAREAPSEPTTLLTVLQFNGGEIEAPDKAIAYLAHASADFVVVSQGTDEVLNAPALNAAYPYRRNHPTHEVFSRSPFEPVDTETLRGTTIERETRRLPRVRSTTLSGARVILVSPDVRSPRTPEYSRAAISSLTLTGDLVRALRQEHRLPMIVAGDFNSTPQGPGYQAFRERSGLRDAAGSLLRSGTWPTALPRWLGIAIDHIFVSEDIVVLSYAIGPDLGGDHRPVIARLRVPVPAAPPTAYRSTTQRQPP